MKESRVAQTAIFLGISLLLVSCKTKKPASDTTPPTIAGWTLIDQSTKEVQKFPGKGGNANVTIGKEYLLTCYGKDPEGLTALSTGAAGTYGCDYLENGSVFTKTEYLSWYPFEGIKSQPDKDGKVETILVYGKKFIVQAKYPCDKKFIPFEGKVTNYAGQVTTGNINLNIQ